MAKIKTSLAISQENLDWLNKEAAIQNMLRTGGRKVTPSSLVDDYVTEMREMDARKKAGLEKLMKELRKQREVVEA